MNERIKDLLSKAGISEEIKSIDYLEPGYSNLCFRVCALDEKIYKVRIGQNNDVIDRKNELQVLKNLKIKPLYYEKMNGDSVWTWIEGNTLSKEEITNEILFKLSEIIKVFHKNKMDFVKIHDHFEYLDKFGYLIGKENEFLYRCLVEKYSDDQKCLCHNDISLSNLIYNPTLDKLELIDYEWSRVNNSYWDYGNFIKEADLSESQIKIFQEFSGLKLLKIYEFAIIATLYSIQLSYVFEHQTPGLEEYRNRLFKQLEKYKAWINLKQ